MKIEIKDFKGLNTVGDETDKPLEYFVDSNNIEVRDGIVYPVKPSFKKISNLKSLYYWNRFSLFTNPNNDAEVVSKSVEVAMKLTDTGSMAIVLDYTLNTALQAQVDAIDAKVIELKKKPLTEQNIKSPAYLEYLREQEIFLQMVSHYRGSSNDATRAFTARFGKPPMDEPSEDEKYILSSDYQNWLEEVYLPWQRSAPTLSYTREYQDWMNRQPQKPANPLSPNYLFAVARWFAERPTPMYDRYAPEYLEWKDREPTTHIRKYYTEFAIDPAVSSELQKLRVERDAAIAKMDPKNYEFASSSEFKAIGFSDRILLYSDKISYEVFFNQKNDLSYRVLSSSAELANYSFLVNVDPSIVEQQRELADLINVHIPTWVDDLENLKRDRGFGVGGTKEGKVTVNYKGSFRVVTWRESEGDEDGFAKTIKKLQARVDELVAAGVSAEQATNIAQEQLFVGGFDYIITLEVNGIEYFSYKSNVNANGKTFLYHFINKNQLSSVQTMMEAVNAEKMYLYIREYKKKSESSSEYISNDDADYRMAAFVSLSKKDGMNWILSTQGDSTDCWKVISRKELTGIFMSQRIGYAYSVDEEGKFITKFSSIAEASGISFAVNNNNLYKCSVGGGNIMKSSFHKQGRIALNSAAAIIHIAAIGNDLGVFTDAGLYVLGVQEYEGDVIVMIKEKTSIIIRDINDVAEFPDGMIVNTPFGILGIGSDKKLISANINNICIDNYENSSVWIDTLLGFVYYFTGTTLYRYSTIRGIWEKFNVSSMFSGNVITIQSETKPYFVVPSANDDGGVYELAFEAATDGWATLPRFTAGDPTVWKTVTYFDFLFFNKEKYDTKINRVHVPLLKRIPSLSVRFEINDIDQPLLAFWLNVIPIGTRNIKSVSSPMTGNRISVG